MDYRSLARKASSAKKHSVAPYSKFRVGAAVLTTGGKTFTGCNIENSSYSLTLCAERTALFKAVSEGYRSFSAIAIASDTVDFVPPCGACRQVMVELAPKAKLVLVNKRGRTRVVDLASLLPMPFSKRLLKK
jgi:cytidine deaminase